jgi:hypothetical protein
MSISFYTHEHSFAGVKFIIVIEFLVTRETNCLGSQCSDINYVVGHDRMRILLFNVSCLFCE